MIKIYRVLTCRNKLLFVKLFCFFILISCKIFGQETSDKNDRIRLLSKGISFYINSKDSLSSQKIINENFTSSDKGILNFYNTANKDLWVKFSLKNNSPYPTLFLNIDYSLLDRVTLYAYKNGALSDSVVAGFNVRNSYQNPFFNLNIKPGESSEYILKVESKAPVFLPLQIGSYEMFQNEFQIRDDFTAIYLGIMIALFLYNAIIFFFVNDRSYIYYILYTIFMALTQVTILGYIWRFTNTGNSFNYFAIILFPCFAGISIIIFAKKFMNLPNALPNRILNFFIAVYAVAGILVFFNQFSISYRIIDTNVLLLAIYLVTISIIEAKKGNRSALFFFIAWLSLIVSIIIYVLRNFGVLPFNKVPSYLLYIGSAVQTILLSIALADRINIYKKETAESQAKALEVSLENEKLVREQNIVLEKEVANRTHELKEANEQLNATLTNLKDTQTQLVEAEKMASLGQLTAGIAHEINNPINFVKSNINPLRLDVKDLIEVLNAYDELHSLNDNQNGYKEKLNAIEELKEDIDLTYVQKEINSLIAGIEEGAERTAEIVRGLRTFSRLDEAELKIVNVHDGILSTIVLLKNNIPYYVKLVKEFSAQGEVECFPGKLNQVFMNIITNGIQAITSKPAKADEESITIRTRDIENDQIEISIKDSGMGMSEEVKHRIFEPFFTTKDVGEGTGLGMAIVFKIIQKHSGKINIITAPNEGAEFIITLPHHYQGAD